MNGLSILSSSHVILIASYHRQVLEPFHEVYLFCYSMFCYGTSISLQTHHVDSTLKRRGNDRFHVVLTWNPRGVFVGIAIHHNGQKEKNALNKTLIYN